MTSLRTNANSVLKEKHIVFMEYLHLKQDMQFFNFEYQFTFVSFFK